MYVKKNISDVWSHLLEQCKAELIYNIGEWLEIAVGVSRI